MVGLYLGSTSLITIKSIVEVRNEQARMPGATKRVKAEI